MGILVAGVSSRLASFGTAQSCAFVRSQSASLTADLEPRHPKVKAQLLCGYCCCVSHGVVNWGGTVLRTQLTLWSPPGAHTRLQRSTILGAYEAKPRSQDQELSCQSEELPLYLVTGTWE